MGISARVLCAALVLWAALPGNVWAEYRSDSDTGLDVLDYIENQRRMERENRLSEEQQKLLQDAKAMEEHLRRPLDPAQPMPVAFEGDDLTYDERTGDFTAKGHVDIVQMDARRFQGENVDGNTVEQVVRVPEKAHLLQLPPNEVRVTLDGYHAVYNYGTRTGAMEAAKGKAGAYYVSGKRFEFYPDRIVIYDGTQTKCGAKVPDYHLSAERIEIWPNDVMKMYHVKLWAGKYVVATKKYHEADLKETGDTEYPKVGYNNDHGAYIEQDFRYYFTEEASAKVHAHVETKKGVRSNAELQYRKGGFRARGVYGFYSDTNNIWLQKEPGLILDYEDRIGDLPIRYNLEYEIGHWRSKGIASTHRYMEIGLTRDPIVFHRWMLFLHTSYTITKESVNNNKVRGMNYDIVLGKDFDPKWAGYVGYHYTKNTTENSVFDFGLDDYSRKLDTGLSYRMDNLNRFAVGLDFDTQKGTLKDVDWFWYHDLHCSQVILRYRQKRSKFEVHWQFTPW